MDTSPQPGQDARTGAELLVDALIAWGVDTVSGLRSSP